MKDLKRLGAAALAAVCSAAGLAVSALATQKDQGPPWCITQDGGAARTTQFSDLQNFLGPGKNLPAGPVSQAANNGGDLWVAYSSGGAINFSASPNGAPIPNGTASDGGTYTSIVHYTVVNGACVSAGTTSTGSTTTTTPTTTSSPPPTTTSVPTTTSTTPAPPTGPVAYICESNSQTDPNVELRSFAYRLWDVGNFVPYAVKGLYGHTKIGGGYSLVCNPYHFHLHFVQKAWVTDHGVKANYLDLGHYPVVSKKAPIAIKVKAKAKTKKR